MNESDGTEAQDRVRALLIRALRAEALGGVCRGEPRDWTTLSNSVSQGLMFGFLLGLAFAIGDWLNASAVWTAAVFFGVLLGFAFLASAATPSAVALLTLMCWVCALGLQVVDSDYDTIETLGFGMAIGIGSVAAWRARKLPQVSRSAPLLLPIALVALLIPLFTAELWRAAAQLTVGNLAALLMVSLVPVTIVVQRRIAGQVPSLIAQGRERAAAESALALGERLAKMVDGDDERARTKLEVDEVVDAFGGDAFETVDLSTVESALRLQLRLSLTLTVGGLLLVGAGYLWLLAWILVPVRTASEWTGEVVPVEAVTLLGHTVSLPVGPYLLVAGLLGGSAAVVLLASAAVQEDLAERLAEAVMRHPVTDAVSLAAPYLLLRGQAGGLLVESASEEPGKPGLNLDGDEEPTQSATV